ncbi:nitroreductase family protein [Microbacterium sp. G2-8]|uniref:nitroreductase family protein n=1 Tax=Microbacterium sp. G2-8 TaxID=2842454 RepID=UPI001C89B74F|nr:nitroreductase family protein [Microbacterium sp. G2-8]
MGAATLDRTASTQSPVLEVLAERWSPRAYCDQTPIDEQKLASALEAARWSPSAYNNQPWRFLVARRGTEAHAVIVESMAEFNQQWAPQAGVIIVAIAELENEDGRQFATAHYDLGQAVAHLSVQAHHDGLFVHQMTGFDAAAVQSHFDLPERLQVVSLLAVGDQGDAATLPEPIRERETAPRERRPVADTVLVDA